MTIKQQLSEAIQDTGLAIIPGSTAVQVYNGGIDAALRKIADDARAIVVDISTLQGRKECASLAYKIARSKTLIDETGKNLGEEARKKINAIDADRKKAREFLDSLKDEVRKPLTDWEMADQKRIEAHESRIAEIVEGGKYTLANWQKLPLLAMRDRLMEINNEAKHNWQEFDARAKREIEAASKAITEAIGNREKHDAELEELVRLRADAEIAKAEKEARDKAQREAEIAERAALKAKTDAELKAKQESEAAERKAQAEMLAIEREKQAAEQRARDAEAATKRAEERVEAAKVAAEEQAEREKQAAVSAERARVAAEQKAKAEADAKREADTKHKATINRAALSALVEQGVLEIEAKRAIAAIANGLVPNVRIAY